MDVMGVEGEGSSGRSDMARGERDFWSAFTLALVFTLTGAMLVVAALLSVVHPNAASYSGNPFFAAIAASYALQAQGAKTVLYVVCFFVVLPLSLVIGSRLATILQTSAGRDVSRGVAAAASAGVLLVPLVVKGLGTVGAGNGVHVLFAVSLAYTCALSVALWFGLRHPDARILTWLGTNMRALGALTLALIVAVLLTLTRMHSVDAVALVLAVAASAAVFACWGRLRLPGLPRRVAVAVELMVAALLLLCITNVVIYHTRGLPSPLGPPGIYQFHQDYLLGPTNQLLGGGALLVNVPVSQYGVGFIDFLYGWFHISPIGYGTYGLLDGVVTALFYIAGYAVVRIAGVRRPLAIAALALAVVAFILHLKYPVGALPQQGPLRFGLPILVVLAAVLGHRWPRRVGSAQALSTAAVAVAAVWSAEMLVYTVFVLAAVTACEAWLRPAERRSFVIGRVTRAAAAILIAHAVLAVWTLAATGHLPDWGGYLSYVNALVLGHSDYGQISYGFDSWSPGLAMGFGCLASGAALVLLLIRAPERARAAPVTIIAIAGTTAYAVALFSYTDNRSSTYLLPYVALPLLLSGTLWLDILISSRTTMSAAVQRAAVALALAVASLMLAAGWPTAARHFSDTALAHVAPGAGLRTALRRLWHSPPIDPRSLAGVRLLARYEPGHGALVVFPDDEDLGTEILIRSRRPNALYIGDPKSDALIPPSQWTGKIGHTLSMLRPGARLITDATGLRIARQLRNLPESVPLRHPLDFLNRELEWVLWRISRRFDLRPVQMDPSGLTVVELRSRS